MYLIDNRVSDQMNATLFASLTIAEIKVATFQMHPDESPRPDGMNPYFYQKFWHIVGPELISHC